MATASDGVGFLAGFFPLLSRMCVKCDLIDMPILHLMAFLIPSSYGQANGVTEFFTQNKICFSATLFPTQF